MQREFQTLVGTKDALAKGKEGEVQTRTGWLGSNFQAKSAKMSK
jgi:hypothetical protein